MNRLNSYELLQVLQCPYCSGNLELIDNDFSCVNCGKHFIQYRNRPVIIRDENELFPPSAYMGDLNRPSENITKKGRLQKIKRLIPSKSVNVAREKMFRKLSSEHGSKHKIILVVGCGGQLEELQRHFLDDKTTFVFCDIDKHADADLYCDAHELAFRSEMFDGVISTAVFEHVLYPDKVIQEIHRVIKQDGFVYSEIPFLQSVHEGAYDFTRFTLSGHRRLLECFGEKEAGMVAGPGTALVWSIVDFSKAVFSHSRLSSLCALISRSMFFWFKYFDYFFKNNPVALDAASCTYFYGVKLTGKITANSIVAKYNGGEFNHI